MKKVMKFVLGFVAVIFIIIAVFLGSFVYVSVYKITKADTSVSPDGTYELVLQAVGEADFPFGSASGRLVLYEGKSRISKADFELFDDGGSIRSCIWEVTWHEDSVEIILSGDEQFDEQIFLYFDGRKERKQLADKEEYTESGDVNNDGKKDIIIICYCFSGAGPTGMVPRPDIRIFIAEENEFYLAEDMVIDIEQHILAKDMTIESVCNYLKNNN